MFLLDFFSKNIITIFQKNELLYRVVLIVISIIQLLSKD